MLNGTNTNPNLAGGLALFNRCNCGGSLRGLVINGFDGDKVQLENGGPYTVQGNYFGTDVTGTMPVANRGDGVHVTANDGVGDLIGGTAAGDGNVISGNDFYGVAFDQSSSNNLLQGNLIGTDMHRYQGCPERRHYRPSRGIGQRREPDDRRDRGRGRQSHLRQRWRRHQRVRIPGHPRSDRGQSHRFPG